MRQETNKVARRPRVSVLTVFFNAERFLEEAIESAFSQTYTDWELLLVDDGSGDQSTRIARDYARRHPEQVRYLEHFGHRNRGISASQNLAIENAMGHYIAFLDSDDVWLPNKLEEQVRLLDARPEAAMLCGATHYWYGWTGQDADRARDLSINPGFDDGSLVDPPAFLVRFLKAEIPVPCPSDVMVRRVAVARTGGFEEQFRRLFTRRVWGFPIRRLHGFAIKPRG